MDNDIIKADLDKLSSEDLLTIWDTNDQRKYKREAFPVIREILTERGINVPPQSLYNIVSSAQGNIPLGQEVRKNNESGIAAFFKFKVLISSSLIKITYFIGMLMITIAGYKATVNGNSNSLIGPAILLFGNLLWRILCEISIIFFRIHDSLASIEKKL